MLKFVMNFILMFKKQQEQTSLKIRQNTPEKESIKINFIAKFIDKLGDFTMNAKIVNGLIKNNINSKSGQKRFVNNIKWFQENNPGKSPWDAIWFVCEPQRAYLQDDASDEEFKDSLKYFCDMLLKNNSWKKLFNVNEELKEESLEESDNTKYVWKHFPGSEDWGLFPRGTKELEEDTAVVILSRMNRNFPWSVYISGKEDKNVLDGCESDNLKDIKDYILKNIDKVLGKKESTLTEASDDEINEYKTAWINALSNLDSAYTKVQELMTTAGFDANEFINTKDAQEYMKNAFANKSLDELTISDWCEEIKSNLEKWQPGKWLEETLTEAPDDDGILNDDELDAEEQKERDEMEARFKARRDKVAQQRADRDAKLAKEQELKAKADEVVAQIGDDWSFDKLFDLLVPASGKCDTLAGEILRAINKLEYRWYNDGDRFFEDYGIETCGQPALFLANIEINDETPFWDSVLVAGENNYEGNYYDRWVEDMKKFAVDTIKANPNLLATETTDMYDIKVSEVEEWLDEHNLIPYYDVDCSIPTELERHLDKSNISERDLIWEIESWIDNIGGSHYDDITIDWGNVYVNGCNKVVYDELDAGRTLYDWLERYAQELTDEYGDPDAEEETEEGEEDEE